MIFSRTKRLLKWNKKHFFLILKCSPLDLKNKLAKMWRTQRLTKENTKEVIQLSDFKIDLIKSNSNANVSEFLDVIYSNLPSRSHTLIDNINNINDECTSGSIMNTILDYLGLSISYYSELHLLTQLQKRNLPQEL